ncbi:alpha/beta hydrolase [soil metagenome]
MSRWVRALEIGAAVTGAAAAAGAAGLAAQRTVARGRARRSTPMGFGSVRSAPHTVVASDGVGLHVEVDEADAVGATEPTLVFVHGWLLTMDCWHFQRTELRGQHRMVFYDQRSHGRSDRSDPEHSTLEQLGHDLATVIEAVAPTGPLVLVGHSMGGMTLMSLAEQLPGLIADRVAGAAFLATSAGHVGRLLPGAPGKLLDGLQPLLVGSLTKLSAVVDAGRRGSAFTMTRRLAFGGPVPDSYVVFVDDMISATSSQVIWDFVPAVRLHRRYPALAAFAGVPVLVVAGANDAILSAGHTERLARELPAARLLSVADAGHLVMLERPDEVNKALVDLVERGREPAVRRR